MTRERRHPDDGGRVTDWTWLEVSTRSDEDPATARRGFFLCMAPFENDLPSGRLPISHSVMTRPLPESKRQILEKKHPFWRVRGGSESAVE